MKVREILAALASADPETHVSLLLYTADGWEELTPYFAVALDPNPPKPPQVHLLANLEGLEVFGDDDVELGDPILLERFDASCGRFIAAARRAFGAKLQPPE